MEDKIESIKSPDLEYEREEYKGITLQRLNKDFLWYAIYNNQIIDWSKYRNDLKSRIDSIV